MRRVSVIVLEIAIAGFAVAAIVVRGAVPGGPVLPATPTAQLDAFSTGVARDSGDVRARLLSPAFRSAIERDSDEA